MPTSDGNGNYIMSRASFWATVAGILILLLGTIYAWGCAFTAVKADVRQNKAEIVAIKSDLKEIKENGQETSTNVRLIAQQLDIRLD